MCDEWLPSNWDLSTFDGMGRYADFLDEVGRSNLASVIRKEWIEADMRRRPLHRRPFNVLLTNAIMRWHSGMAPGYRVSWESVVREALAQDKVYLDALSGCTL